MIRKLLIILGTFILGFFIGRLCTIHQAKLYEVTDYEYYLDFGGEIHEYSIESEAF